MSSVFKQIFKSLLCEKATMSVLFFLSCLGSFMYFFVQVSIDGNLKHLAYNKANGILINSSQKELLIALHSNQILAATFLIIFSVIAAFAFYMFFLKYYRNHLKEIGCYKAFGCSNKQIIAVMFFINSSLSFIAFIVGFILGWICSDVLLQLYRSSFDIESLQKGIFPSNLAIGFLFIVVLSGIMAIVPYYKFLKFDISSLLCNFPEEHQNKWIVFISNKLSNAVPIKYRRSFRIALRKPLAVSLLFLSVGCFTVLWIMSMSLHFSSQYIYETQTLGRSYKYDIQFENYQPYHPLEEDSTFYLRSNVKISWKGNEINQQAIGFHKKPNLFQFYTLDHKELFLPKEKEVYINEALSELYGIRQNDYIEVNIKHKIYKLKVAAIVGNAENKTIYLSEPQLASMLSIKESSYNGILSNTVPKQYENKSIITEKERLAYLQKNNVSNKISAVINQLLGCMIGCLLLYLVILLNFQDCTRNILILNMLGYSAKSINKMLISIYKPLLNVAFIIMVSLSVIVCQFIQKSLSIKTGDYIPFQTNLFIIGGIWLLLNLLYHLIHCRFNNKIEKIQNAEQTKKYIL
ncbi:MULTISPECIES: FtsX-like permease family protein [Lysinibacillus]|jgi:putative ABC transport system permease protein|uniref:ABC transporter permease n=1 Tax=Lysinibacillus fusiformis TaxID=28031 RepID=A0A2I0V3X3_9BACI|nr:MULTISPECIES: ABC transporter permease [Lysinibacillus]KUF36745.1 hypothetical protein AK833_02240 [Lysinibacillus sp. F5]PKU53010.1 ABC transporter permease [Lysinibacillus fusiformis]